MGRGSLYPVASHFQPDPNVKGAEEGGGRSPGADKSSIDGFLST